MKWRDWLQRWVMTNLKITTGFAEAEFAPKNADREAAWGHARDHLPSQSWSRVSFGMFDDRMRRDARAAFSYRNDLSMVDPDPTYWYERLGGHWPKASIDELLRVTREVPPGESRSMFVASLVHYTKQPQTIDGCLDLLQLVPGESNARHCLHQRLKELQSDIHGDDAAKKWAQTIADPAERRTVMRSLPNYEPDLDETMRLLREDDARDSAALIRDVVVSPGVTLPELGEWIGNLPDSLREDGLETVLATLPPAEALDYADRFLREDPNWKYKRAIAIRRGFDDERGDRGKWLEAAMVPEEASSVLNQLLKRWASKDPMAAETWVKSQDLPAVNQAFASMQLETRLNQPDQDWPVLLEQAEALESPQGMRENVIRRWARADPKAALDALGQSDDEGRMSRIQKETEQHRAVIEAVQGLAD